MSLPCCKISLESENIVYLGKDLGIEITSDMGSTIKEYFRILKFGYWNLMRNSTIVTNSEFTRKAIVDAFKIDSNSIHILSPPIDIDTFSDSMLTPDKVREDIILVVSRIAAHKEIENAISLAKTLKKSNIGKRMIIVGNLYNYFEYYSRLKQMVLDLDLADYLTFEINASLDKLLSIMRKAKVYFSPRAEPFGMAVLEAMAAGLVPIVPSTSGSAEFVPQQYHYSTLEQAADLISQAFHIPSQKRAQISKSVDKFSNSHYIEEFQRLVNQLLSLSDSQVIY